MSGTAEIALREDNALAPQYDAALAIQPGQTAFDEMQRAALRQLGLDDAPDGDLSVFLHVSQRTGLDPFSRQIYMIGRNEKVPGTRDQWRKKYTIQTGIDGLRVLRARAERAAGVRGVLSPPVFYDTNGNASKVWVKPGAPAACEITYTVRDANGDTPYTSILRFTEYAQYKDVQLTAQWAVKHAHMLEKCTEADVYRKAFPQDFSGIHLEDAMPRDSDGETSAPARADRPRITADAIRERTRQTVTAVVVTPDPSPAADGSATAPPAPAEAAGEGPSRDELLLALNGHLERLGVDTASRIGVVSRIARHPAASTMELSDAHVQKAHDTLEGMDDPTDLD
ncbi:MAG TPA: recombinase RecT, partial [Streptosporangiaceae bacterium]|nr:recombinase RecT [Streptosporangiaceae bacterium]